MNCGLYCQLCCKESVSVVTRQLLHKYNYGLHLNCFGLTTKGLPRPFLVLKNILFYKTGQICFQMGSIYRYLYANIYLHLLKRMKRQNCEWTYDYCHARVMFNLVASKWRHSFQSLTVHSKFLSVSYYVELYHSSALCTTAMFNEKSALDFETTLYVISNL